MEPNQDQARGFEDVPTYAQCERVGHRTRTTRTSLHVPNSRRRRRMSKRAPVRDSRRGYRIAVIRAHRLSDFRTLSKSDVNTGPQTIRVPKTAQERIDEDEAGVDVEDDQVSAAPALIDLTGNDSDEDDDAGQVPWPDGVVHIFRMENPDRLEIPDVGSVDWCGCQEQCRPDECQNALTDLYCDDHNCAVGSSCGNRPQDLQGLQLRRIDNDFGIGVFTTEYIAAGTVVGAYTGVLTDHDYPSDEGQPSHYTLQLKTRSVQGRTLYVEGKERGGMARFINHSCDPNCELFEVRNRRRIAVLVISVQEIASGDQITVNYGDDLWFQCKCGASGCQSARNALSAVEAD